MPVVVGLYRLALAALTLVALFREPGGGLRLDLEDYVYFTNQSNLAMAVVMLWGAGAAFARRRGPQPWLVGAVTLYLVITALVSALILDPPEPGQPSVLLGLTKIDVVHTIAPAATVVHFLLMTPHRRLRVAHAGWWLLYPVAYCAFATVRGVVSPGSAYPYGFVDVAQLGYGGLLRNVVIYGVGFFLLGLALVGIDRLLPARALLRDGAPDEPRPHVPTREATTSGRG